MQTPIAPATADTLFHSMKVPLVKWFRAIYLTAYDKGGISALRLSKYIEISWIPARSMLKKIRTVMAHRDSIYRLEKLIEPDDACVGEKRTGEEAVAPEGYWFSVNWSFQLFGLSHSNGGNLDETKTTIICAGRKGDGSHKAPC
ncbi:hypothetical protein HNQ81_002388 [Desulfoprunum benzoelyticum]|uniref:Transposase n=1 Tax=Desulfoprunum benzoelyticum TaxID=1506996 RepID=A0A840V1A9_9BACT|nr:hypothetical protein [Desulfoprunum benzoelyticum]